MKIGFISDTHGNLDKTIQALEILNDVDHIFHLGDVLAHGPRNPITSGYAPKELAEILKDKQHITYIRGNCDADVDEMVMDKDLSCYDIFKEIGDLRIYATHGYRETEDERLKIAKQKGANVIVTGHTHVKVLTKKEDIIILNPGSPALSKDGSESIARYKDGVFELIDINSRQILKKLSLK